MSQTISHFRLPSAQPTLRERVKHVGVRIGAAFRDAATRRQLATLDDRALSDIGIGRAQAMFEAEQPVWQVMPSIYR